VKVYASGAYALDFRAGKHDPRFKEFQKFKKMSGFPVFGDQTRLFFFSAHSAVIRVRPRFA
jgi:hypothetical protein